MRRARPCAAWAGACALLIALCPQPVIAQSTEGAALLPFTGKSAAAMRKRLHKRLSAKGVDLVPLGKASQAARANKGRAKIARALDVGTVVTARVQKARDQWIADVSVYNDRGKRLKRFRVSASSVVRLANRAAAKLVQLDVLSKKVAPRPIPVAAQPEPPSVVPAPPRAVSGSPRLVVRRFVGRNAPKIRVGAVRAFVGKPVKLVPNRAYVDKAEETGADLGKSSGQVKAAQALGIDALVDGDVEREGTTWTAYVRLVDGETGQVLQQEYYEERTAAALSRRIERSLWNGFRGALAELRSDRGAALVSASKKDTSKEGARDRRRDERRQARYRGLGLPTAFDLEFDFRLIHRQLGYNDDLRGDLRDYRLAAGPGFQVRARWYPGAHFVANGWSQFGIDAHYERLFDFESQRAEDGLTFPSQSRAWGIGLRWRYDLKRLQPSLMVGYGQHSFEVLVAGPPRLGLVNTPQIPKFNYEFLRYQGEIRWDVVAGLKLMIRGAFLQVLQTGGVSSPLWFERARANGMEAELLFGYALPLGFEIRTGFDYRRYFFDLRPKPPNPPFVAGGALDQYWGFTLGIAWRY